MRCVCVNVGAVGATFKGEILVGKWATIVAIHTTPIATLPEGGTTPDVAWLAIANDITRASISFE